MRISDWSSDVCSSELFDAIQCFPPRKVCRARHTVNAAPYRIPAPMPDKPSTGGAFSPTVARLLLAAVIILWGANWPVMKIGVEAMPPVWFATARMVLGALSLFALLAVLGRLKQTGRASCREGVCTYV